MSDSDYTKTSEPGMVKDKATGAIINTNMGAYEAIKRAREAKKEREGLVHKVNELEIQVQDLQNKVKDLEERLFKVILQISPIGGL